MVLLQANGKISSFGDGSSYITPFDIFFRSYKIIDINFFDFNGLDTNSFIYKFRTSVAYWFYGLRFISSAILLCILIYVGIRMAISTIAEDKAKYKKMLVDWVCSLALIFLLQYLAIGIIYLNNAIVDSLRAILVDGNTLVNITDLMNDLAYTATLGVGFNSLVAVLIYCGIVAQTIFFFIAYINRMLKVGFLIIISPLISITYSIDKMGDGKAQALNNWLKEFSYTILIQPFHCIMYIALINTAFSLVTNASAITLASLPNLLKTAEFNKFANGVLAILCLKFVNDGEKVVRKIFGFSDDNSKTSMAAGAIATVAVLSNAKKIGNTTRKGINSAKSSARSLRKAIGTDINKVRDSSKFNKLTNAVTNSKLGKIGSNIGEKTKSTGRLLQTTTKNPNKFKTLKNLKNSATSLGGKYRGSGLQKAVKLAQRKARSNIPRALSTMGMMMAYSTGTTSLLEANAVRKGITDGATEFFYSSTATQADLEEKNMQKVDDEEYEDLVEDLEEAEDSVDTQTRALGGMNTNDLQEEGKEAAEEAAKAADVAKKKKQEYDKAVKDSNAARIKLAREVKSKQDANSRQEKAEAEKRINKVRADLKNKQKEMVSKQKAHEKAKKEANRLNEKANKYKQLQNAIQKRDLLKQELEDFYTEAAMKARIKRRISGPSNSELEKKKNQILQLIFKLKMQQSRGEEEDITKDNLITEDDRDNAIRTTDNITKAIDLAVLKGGASIQAQDLIKDKSGLDDRSRTTLDSIDKAAKEYERLRREVSIAETFNRHASYNGEIDDLVDAMYKNLRGASEE